MESVSKREDDRRSLIEKRCEIRRITTRRTGVRRLALVSVEMEKRSFEHRRQAKRRLEARRVNMRRSGIDRRQDPRRFQSFITGEPIQFPGD